MDLTMSSGGKAAVFVVILMIFGVAGWSIGAPESFHTALADAGVEQPAPPPAPPALTAPAPAPQQPAPAPDSNTDSNSH